MFNWAENLRAVRRKNRINSVQEGGQGDFGGKMKIKDERIYLKDATPNLPESTERSLGETDAI